MNRRLGSLFISGIFILGGTSAAWGDVFTFTNIGGNSIQQVDTATNTITTIVSGAPTASPDSLIFNGNAIIYSNLFAGSIGVVNTNGTGNHLIATGLGGFTQDIALQPGGTGILVSETDTGVIYHIDLTTNAKTTFASLGLGSNPRGITYDNSGNLFVVVNGTGTVVDQLNPTTGAVLNSVAIPSLGFADGLTFDPVSGKLWAGGGTTVWSIPTSLSAVTTFHCTTCATDFDGTEADGNGNIDLADTGGTIWRYNIAGNSFLQIATTPGIDDLAPVTGLGAPPPSGVPEPSSIILVGPALLGLVALRRRLARW
jgi:streptogramin lyase